MLISSNLVNCILRTGEMVGSGFGVVSLDVSITFAFGQ